jgi:hypothetical protein
MHGVFLLFIISVLGLALPQLRSVEPNANPQERGQMSYMPVDIKESFSSIMSRMTAAKPDIEKEHTDLLNERYDLSNRTRPGRYNEGVRVKLPAGITWERLAAMSPDEIREHDLYPKGFYPLPHPNFHLSSRGLPSKTYLGPR